MKKLGIPVKHIHAVWYTFNILLKKLTFIVRIKKSTFDYKQLLPQFFSVLINVIALVFQLV